MEDGALDEDDDTDDGIRRISDSLLDRGVGTVLVSRGDEPILATTHDARYEISGPISSRSAARAPATR